MFNNSSHSAEPRYVDQQTLTVDDMLKPMVRAARAMNIELPDMRELRRRAHEAMALANSAMGQESAITRMFDGVLQEAYANLRENADNMVIPMPTVNPLGATGDGTY